MTTGTLVALIVASLLGTAACVVLGDGFVPGQVTGLYAIAFGGATALRCDASGGDRLGGGAVAAIGGWALLAAVPSLWIALAALAPLVVALGGLRRTAPTS
jgi:hypothetical protein